MLYFNYDQCKKHTSKGGVKLFWKEQERVFKALFIIIYFYSQRPRKINLTPLPWKKCYPNEIFSYPLVASQSAEGVGVEPTQDHLLQV